MSVANGIPFRQSSINHPSPIHANGRAQVTKHMVGPHIRERNPPQIRYVGQADRRIVSSIDGSCYHMLIRNRHIQISIQCCSLSTSYSDSELSDKTDILFTALLYYDYSLTFPDEIKYIWGSKLSLSALSYVGCRYALVANVVYILAYLNIIHDRVSLG